MSKLEILRVVSIRIKGQILAQILHSIFFRSASRGCGHRCVVLWMNVWCWRPQWCLRYLLSRGISLDHTIVAWRWACIWRRCNSHSHTWHGSGCRKMGELGCGAPIRRWVRFVHHETIRKVVFVHRVKVDSITSWIIEHTSCIRRPAAF